MSRGLPRTHAESTPVDRRAGDDRILSGASDRRGHRHGPRHQPGQVCRTPAFRRAVVRAAVPKAADGQSADRSASGRPIPVGSGAHPDAARPPNHGLLGIRLAALVARPGHISARAASHLVEVSSSMRSSSSGTLSFDGTPCGCRGSRTRCALRAEAGVVGCGFRRYRNWRKRCRNSRLRPWRPGPKSIAVPITTLR